MKQKTSHKGQWVDVSHWTSWFFQCETTIKPFLVDNLLFTFHILGQKKRKTCWIQKKNIPKLEVFRFQIFLFHREKGHLRCRFLSDRPAPEFKAWLSWNFWPKQPGWLVGWLVGWWVGGWVGWLVGGWVGGWVGWLVGWLVGWWCLGNVSVSQEMAGLAVDGSEIPNNHLGWC